MVADGTHGDVLLGGAVTAVLLGVGEAEETCLIGEALGFGQELLPVLGWETAIVPLCSR